MTDIRELLDNVSKLHAKKRDIESELAHAKMLLMESLQDDHELLREVFRVGALTLNLSKLRRIL